MANYTEDEIVAVVSNLVKSSVKTKRDPLGPIDIDAKFVEVQELIASTLIFDSNAIYYLIYLITNELNKDVEDLLGRLNDLRQAIVVEIGRRTSDIIRTALLGDAAAALLTVDQILTERDALSQNALVRYERSVDQFITTSLKPNIKEGNSIVRSPQEARGVARTQLTEIATAYLNVLERVTKIQGALDEFMGLKLPILVAQDSIRSARQDIKDMQAYFENPSIGRESKIAEARDAYLKLTAGKSLLENYTTVLNPEDPRLRSSTTTRGAVALPAGTLGVLQSATTATTKSAPWAVTTAVDDQLLIANDGGAPVTYTIPVADQPTVTGILPGPFDIHVASTASVTSINPQDYTVTAPTVVFSVLVDGLLFEGPLTAGVRTGAQVAADIGALTNGPTTLSTIVAVSYTTGINLTHLTAGEHNITIVAPTDPALTVNAILGFTYGQTSSGQAANNLLEIDALPIQIALPPGGAVTAATIATTIGTWASTNYPGIYSAAAVPEVAITKTVAGSQTLTLTAAVNTATVERALSTLGLYKGQQDTAAAVTAAEVAKVINDVGNITASVVQTRFESGTNGEVTGTASFRVPLNTIASTAHVDDQLLIRAGTNGGYHRIMSIVRGVYDVVTVDVTTPFAATGTDLSWMIVREALTLTSKAATLSTSLVVGAGTANTKLGLTAGTYVGTTTGFQALESGTPVSFGPLDIVAGDTVSLTAAPQSTHTVIEALTDQLEITPALATNRTNLDFVIYGAATLAHDALQTQLTAWTSDMEASAFHNGTQELNRVCNPVLVNLHPTAAQINDAKVVIDDLITLVTDLSTVLIAFVVSRSPRMDASLSSLKERGLDRAYDTLMVGDIAAFFDMDKDDAVTSAYMLKTMRALAQEDVRISKYEEDMDDRALAAIVQETDANYTYDDMDKDEGKASLGGTSQYADELRKERY